MLRKISMIFFSALVLNALWENLHSFLYTGYMGGKITEYILLRASVVDAVIITLLCLPFIILKMEERRSWIIIPVGVVVAVVIELYALHTGRWAYNAYMPILPVLGVGLTPAIQLGFLGYLSYWFAGRVGLPHQRHNRCV